MATCNIGLYILIIINLVNASQKSFPLTLIELRGLWCISQQNTNTQNYTQQLGQAFFYNNGTFTLNFLGNISDTWINYFISINDTDGEGTYQVFTDTTQGPPEFINVSSCFWRRRVSNGDLVWGRQSNGTCTPTFENEVGLISIAYTRNNAKCKLYDDEGTFEILTNTYYESELLQFDQLLTQQKRKSVVFFGSSSFRLWLTFTEDFADVPSGAINRGFGGSSLKECWQQFKRIVLPLEPSALMVYAGENDVAAGATASSVFFYFQQFILTVRQFYPSVPIAYISIKPSPSRVNKLAIMNETNNLIRENIRNLTNVQYIDVFSRMLDADNKPRQDLFLSDNLHMNTKGYAIWTPLVKEFLKQNGLMLTATATINQHNLLSSFVLIIVSSLFRFIF